MLKCKRCGSTNLEWVKTPQLVHEGKWICKDCGAFVKWGKNEKKNIRTRTSMKSLRGVAHFYKMKTPRCFFCGRAKDELGANETLTIDHIIPLSEGGEDEVWNLQILCTACHKLKNWVTTYVTNHLVRKNGNT